MRLTEKIKDSKGEERVFTKYVKDNQKLKDEKLCDIEKIEAKIGIEIVDFYRLTQADKIYLPRFKAYYQIHSIDVRAWEIIVYNNRKIPCAYTLKIKNYGKTWLFKKGGDNEQILQRHDTL